jgi:transglutaminase-like putative cysteine protease
MRPRVPVRLLFLLFCPVLIYAQPKGVSLAKKSSWVEDVDYDAQAKPKDGEGSSYYYLLMDQQENAGTQESFEHYAYTILTTEGIQNMSDLSFEFEPTYQQLILHEIKIIRNGSAINQLSKDIQVIQREQSLESNLYDGTKTAIVNLRDIRVGDIIDYSFTRKGYNPVYKGHFNRVLYLDSYQSIDKSFNRVTLPVSHKVTFKTLGEDVPEPVIEETAGMVDYRWSRSKVTGKEFEYSTPGWYNTNNIAMISDFESWRDVGEWAKGLFALPDAELEKIKTKIAPSFKATDDEAYILEVIRFVQDEVRYLGLETGINSHKPYPPMQIYNQRFGDCKDKSLLLTTLLQARGIEAYPMLINTSLKQSIDERLPSGLVFDHCVVQIIFKGKKINIDPTISNQGGDLDSYHFPDYRRGLVIDNDVAGLDELEEPEPATTTEIQTFDVATIGGEAMLTVRTTYTSSDADYQRSLFATTPLETTQKNYKDYHANLYPDIVVWEEIKFTDDRAGNTFSIEEKYKIPSFWKPFPDKEEQIYASVQPLSVTAYFDVPKNIQQRTQPYYLSYPVDYHHTIHINLPEDFAVTPAENIISNASYEYEYEVKKRGNEITKTTHYKTKKDHIPADKIQKYISDHERMFNELVFQLTYDRRSIEASKNTLPGVITSIGALVGGVLLCIFLYHRFDPQPARYMVKGTPIGGWLVLLAFGLVISPLRLLYEVFTTPEIINGAGWMSFLAIENYGYFTFSFLAHVFNLVKILFVCLLLVLFFERRSSFPMLMSVLLATQFVVLSIDTILARAISDDPSTVPLKDFAQAFVGAAIWIPYLNISQRVKETFVIRGPHHDDDDTDRPAEQVEASMDERVSL